MELSNWDSSALLPVVFQLLIRPRPFVSVVVAVHLLELGVDVLQAVDDRVAKELIDGNLIKFDTFHQSRIAYLGIVIRVDIQKLATGIAQILQSRHALEHLLHGIGTEQVVIDIVQLVWAGVRHAKIY